MSSIVRPVKAASRAARPAGRPHGADHCVHSMSASQAVSLTCSVAPGRRRVRGWGRRGAARARATCVRATCAVRGCVWIFQRFGFSSARAHGACSLCYLTRALIRLRPRTVTARDGTMPRTCGRKLTRSRRAERPRPGPGLQLYIYIPRLEYRRAAFFQNARASPHTNVH